MIETSIIVNILAVIEIQALKMLQVLDEDASYVRELKIKMLKAAGVEGDSIKFIQDLDQEAVRIWRETVIAHFIAAYPGKYRSRLEFNDWSGAMRQLRYIERVQNNNKQFK